LARGSAQAATAYVATDGAIEDNAVAGAVGRCEIAVGDADRFRSATRIIGERAAS
jgi:hypothetical protein